MIPDDTIHPAHEGDVQYPFADVGRSELMYIETLYAMKHRRREFSYFCTSLKKVDRFDGNLLTKRKTDGRIHLGHGKMWMPGPEN